MARQIDFAGKSGTIYRYTGLDEDRPLPPAGANYVIAAASGEGATILYAGETDNLSRGDFRRHLEAARRTWPEAEVLTRLNVRSAVRLAEQEDLAEEHHPEMNDGPRSDTPRAGEASHVGS